MQVTIDASKCLGNARCAAVAPEVFDVDDDGFSLVLTAHPQASLAERVRLAARSCPTGAVSVVE